MGVVNERKSRIKNDLRVDMKKTGEGGRKIPVHFESEIEAMR